MAITLKGIAPNLFKLSLQMAKQNSKDEADLAAADFAKWLDEVKPIMLKNDSYEKLYLKYKAGK